MDHASDKPAFSLFAQLFLLSAGVLGFEITLTRLFSISQFYHFAFMVVSIALLGFGASGTFLSLFPEITRLPLDRWQKILGTATAFSMLGAYLFTNHFPFDSFQIAWNRNQFLLMLLHYFILSLPFLFAGAFISLCLTKHSDIAGRIYAVNMGGSATGCLLAMIFPFFGGGEGAAIYCSALVSASVLCTLKKRETWNSLVWLNALLLIIAISDVILVAFGFPHPEIFQLKISPYKSLSYAMQYPQARLISQKWNSFSRVDVVRSAGIRSLPGLSIRFTQQPPPQDGLFVDGDDLSPILLSESDLEFLAYLPLSVVGSFVEQPNTLVLEPRGGLDILSVIGLGARRVTAVELNPLIVQSATWIYAHPKVTLHSGLDRSYLRQSAESYDLIVLSLTNSFHPIRSGAYSLMEDYRNTVEAYADALARLSDTGVLFITRWLQSPPSESLRTFATLIQALERHHLQPGEHIIAFRSYNTISFIASRSQFPREKVEAFKTTCEQLAFDLVYYPGIREEETNRFTVLPEPIYYRLFMQLLQSPDREHFFQTYPYEVKPSTDDHPFFGHYFKWSQFKQVIEEFGKSWQPFGGAGFLVLILLLIVVLIVAIVLIWVPVGFASMQQKKALTAKEMELTSIVKGFPLPVMAYFFFIGLAYLLVEIPLIQKFILYLGHPAYALSLVLFSLLTFSALGSLISHRLKPNIVLPILVILVLSTPWILNLLFTATLGLNIVLRISLSLITMMPLGLLMGIPFPSGVIQIYAMFQRKSLIPWVWAVNGTASVLASIIAALLALSAGFMVVFWSGAACYFLAWICFMALRYLFPLPHPLQ